MLLALNMFLEYSLHGAKWLDNYVATDVVADWMDLNPMNAPHAQPNQVPTR